METYKTINYKNHKIEIIQDEFSQSPDDWGNTDLFLIYDHRDFTINREGFNGQELYNYYCLLNMINDPKTSDVDRLQYQMEIDENYFDFNKNYFIFPVYAYIHSGIALSLGNNSYPFSCNFDTSFAGFIIADKKELDFDLNRQGNDKLLNMSDQEIAYYFAEGLIKEWNDYLSGNVYGYQIYDNNDLDNEIDSCWGFYGDPEKSGIIEECKNVIDNLIKHNPEKYAVQLELNLFS